MFYEDVLTALQAAGVRFVLVGGLAVILHGVPRSTADLDLAVELSPENLLRLVQVLARLGFRPRAPVPAEQLADAERRREWIEDKGMIAFTFVRAGRALDEVDVLIDSPIDYERLARGAESLEAEGLTLAIASVNDLIEMKRASGRAHDLADIHALERLRGERP